MKVFVALSGGVDSAVAAHMLQTEGHHVTGVFIRVWQPDFLPCSQDEEERAAMRVAAHLGIPFQTLDLSDVYKRDVVDEMINEYSAGRTPNPDVLCNSSVKFGAFLDYALKEGADKIATGHHAYIAHENEISTLHRGVDSNKDQAYFLWKLTQYQLSHTLMPIGSHTKEQVRAYAEQHNIPSAVKPDSQGLCFIGHVDMKTFLENFIETRAGEVLNEKGDSIGTHDGAVFMTLGQRGGFTVTDKEAHGRVYYVIAKDMERNTITVSEDTLAQTNLSETLHLRDTNFSVPITKDSSYQCEIRYHGTPVACTVTETQTGADVQLTESVRMAAGQSLVIYDNDICVGGGVVI